MADIFELFKKIEKKKEAVLPVTHIIAGLGNPGVQYEKTRHNAGFLAIDHMSKEKGFRVDRSKFQAFIGEVNIGNTRALVMKPQTYMNKSGEAIYAAAQFYKIPIENIIVIVDDITLAPGAMRIRAKGSAGGHNGLKNIIEHFQSNSFSRIRIGVGEKPNAEYDLADWVTGNLSSEDLAAMRLCFDACYDAVELIMDNKTELAMGRYNGMKKQDKSKDKKDE